MKPNLHTLSSAGVPAARLSLLIDGMTCASCVARVEKALAKVDGVLSAQVNNRATETARGATGRVLSGPTSSRSR